MQGNEDATELKRISAFQATCKGENIRVELVLMGQSSPFELKSRFTTATGLRVHIACSPWTRTRGKNVSFTLRLPTSAPVNDPNWREPLIWACKHGFTQVVEALIGYGACTIKKKEGRMTPLHYASRCGSVDIVKALIVRLASECDPSVSIINVTGFGDKTPLHLASECGHLSVVNELITNGADLYRRDELGNIALHCACSQGHVEVAKFLQTQGRASVNSLNNRGESALHSVISWIGDRRKKGKEIEIAKNLLADGACINECSSGGTPLALASKEGNVEMVEFLLMMGARINEQLYYNDYYNELTGTALHHACDESKVKSKDIFNVLLHHGADVNLNNGMYEYPLLLAYYAAYEVGRGPPDDGYFVRALLQHGAVVDKSDSDDLPFSVDEGDNTDIILLDYGVGSGVKCHCQDCCGDATQLACVYRKSRFELRGHRELFPGLLSFHSSVRRDCFEQLFIKRQAAGISVPEEQAADPPVKGVDWSQQRRDAYQSECEAELEKAKITLIPNTTATYYDLLTRNLTCLRDEIIGNFNFDACLQAHPIYGDMMGCSYVRLQRFFLLNQTAAIFYLTEPHLPPECSRLVLRYLRDQDLFQLLNMIQVRVALAARRARQSDNCENRKRAAEFSHDGMRCCTPESFPSSSKKFCAEK